MKKFIYLMMLLFLLLGMIPSSTVIAEATQLTLEPQVTCSESIVVTNTSDSGAGSLRQALSDVCAGGLITFAESLSGQTILLSSQLTLDKNVTIEAEELTERVILDAGFYDYRVFEVNSGMTAEINSLRITHGNVTSSGGGILNYGNLTVVNSVFFNNYASQYGGGIYNHGTGTLTIVESTFYSNSAGTGFSGGGIYNAGTLMIVSSNLELNSASMNGGAIYNAGTLSMENSTLTQNNAAVSGGGIYNTPAATATLNGCTLSLNTTQNGGGISIEGGNVTVRDSTFSANAASSRGGGIFITGGATGEVIGSTFVNNSAGAMGGGGIKNFSSMSVVNSTFTGNTTTASSYGSAIDNSISGTQLTLYNSTLSGNGGPYTLKNDSATLNYANTIIANTDSGSDCFNNAGTISTNTNNLVEADVDNLCAASLSADPMLDALADNGGPTQTMALLEGSPAIDDGDATICGGTLVGGVDQRGVERPQGVACDIGAYEVEFPYLWQQLPDGVSAIASYSDSTILYDDFELASTKTIRQIEFWSSTAGPIEIFYGLYENADDGSGNDIPGDEIYSAGTGTLTGTLEDEAICADEYCQYRYSFTPNQTLTAGHYWMRIHGSTEFYWSSAAAEPSENYAIVDTIGKATLVPGNLAFRLLEHVAPRVNYIDIYPEPSYPGFQVWGEVNFQDPDFGSHSVMVDWGDGTVVDGGSCGSYYCDLLYHTYEAVGTYTVQVSITDEEDLTGTGSTQHEVVYVMAVEDEAEWLASNTVPTTLEIYGETLTGHTPLNFTVVTQPEQGSIGTPTNITCEQAEWDEDFYICRAVVVYTPVNGDIGDYSFTFTVDDGLGNISEPGTVRLWVRENSAPTAEPSTHVASTVIPKTIMLTATDPDAYNWTVDRLSFFIDTPTSNGTLGSISRPECFPLEDESYNPIGVTCSVSVLYTPNEGTTAESDSFTFYVNDTHQDSEPATISLDLHAPETIYVNSNDDSNDGTCDETHCSLREAVGAALDGDIIVFDIDLPNIITLSQAYGELLIDKVLTINGPGAGQLSISGGGGEPDNPEGTRVFRIGNYDFRVNVTISGLTIRDGRESSGGGVYVYIGSSLTMNDCVIGPNNIVTYAGGGIFNNGGHLTLNRCTVTENEGTGSLGGAGVTTAFDAATTTIINSTISGNITNNYGGGIFVGQDCIVTLIHTTVSGNISNQNYLDPYEERGGGAGIYIESEEGSDNLVYIQNSILAGNTDMTDPETAGHEKWPDVYGNAISLGGNIIGDPTGSITTWDSSDLVGTAESPLDPLLGALTINEPGTTLTMALLEGSQAIDAAPTCEVTNDQRGVGRPQGSACDIGAYEYVPAVTNGELRITKTFAPLTSGFTGTFAINYDCDDGTTHDGTVNLAAGGSQTITGIPTGTTCTVTEPTLPNAPTGWYFGLPAYNPTLGVVTVKEGINEVSVTNTIISKEDHYEIFLPLIIGGTSGE